LSFRYFGPFVVLEKIVQVAYRLDLPTGSQIHPVFHVSQLKQALIADTKVMSSLSVDLSTLQVPEKILQCRVVTRGLHSVPQVLIQWSSSTDDMTTWEDFEAFRQRFPDAPAWGQAGALGGGSVMAGIEMMESSQVKEAGSGDAMGQRRSKR
jgi:hypothetical protein